MREYKCSIRTSGGKFRTIYSPAGALAAWDNIEIRCKKLNVDFYAAKCKNLNCNLKRFKINKPQTVYVKTSPVFVSKHLRGMPEGVETLIPVACYCHVVS